MEAITLRSFAKINPFLAVGEKRADGYHEVRTKLQAVSLHDRITISPSNQLEIECSDANLSGEKNLAWKALRLLSEAIDLPAAKICISKEIPMMAGLGGGSSNAGFLLRAMNRLMGKPVSSRDLSEIALACGADVTFFASGMASAWATGVGEKLTHADQHDVFHLVIAMPRTGVASAAGYAALDRLERTINLEGDPFRNDFELVAPRGSLDLIERLTHLGAVHAMLTGSGSAVIGVARNEAHAEELHLHIRDFAAWSDVSKTLTQEELDEQWMC
ncbi:MAG: 4-(cytidine 5'-diphospho)-2-C-methyl-D-erythritol kinase [Fimbriimonadales bacterium]